MIDIQKHINVSIDTIYQSYLSLYEKDLGFHVLLKYYGEFSVNLIRSFADGVEEIMIKLGDKRHVIKRMFSILVEGLQNIHLHGGLDDNGQQTAFLIVTHNNLGYKVLFGNIVEPEDRSSVKTYLGNINNHSDEELKQLYLSILKDGYLSQKGGAGLGIVTMRIKSSEDLQYRIYDLPSNKAFLVMEVELNKQ
ncbi:hypothetical protein H9Y05_02090 [Crocinitomicaceae bacterium CZZ-1]|uniref:Uncharacterized protein n=1 Tax=Taishania pollutisoli TaxID=2766479 RepID=A0A8J6PDD1_9FLAO|nr:SiaB family protein kinase [Taishania pollutisoli]MBC9811255.1 hypothetical protein [Taishania pollutisoli]MBX2947830.1 SiaB family protein kinase [Crocinitomicaceae bacterium]NGF75038.1 hypothetical protein [Fluviicola sp. SGL-29]